MAPLGSRRGEANLGLPLMLITFLAIGGFMYYLYATAEPTQPAVLEEVDETSTEVGDGTPRVTPDELKTGADAFVGQVVRLEGVPVSSTMGRETFFVDLPASDNLPATPFLVHLGPDLVAQGMTVAVGEEVAVRGPVMIMNDSIVNAWVEGGMISQGDRILVEFATHFMEAESVEITEEPGAPAGS